MEIRKSPPLSAGIRFPVSKRKIAESFSNFASLTCHFGFGGHGFRWDSRCFERPKLSGPVVASLGVSRARSAMLQLYPIAESVFPLPAAESFGDSVVPHLVLWLEAQMAKPDTAVLGYEQIIVCWTGDGHEYVQVRYL